PAGRILQQRMACDGVQSDGNPCGGTNAVRATANEYNRLGWLMEQAINSDVDLMRYDASGNLRWKQHTTWNPDSFYVAPHSNRVTQIVKGTGATDSIAHELDGSRRSEWSAYTATRAYFYDGRGRTSGIRSWVQLPGLDWQFIGNPENCGYDPLGRPFRACASAAPLLAFDGDNIVRAQN